MSNKRREQDGGRNQRDAGPGGDKRPRRQKHFYLVLDDWDKGYSVYKMDADSLDTDDLVTGHLPEPPALRLESPVCHGLTSMSFSAMGTKIFVSMNQRCSLIYDTETAVLAVGAHAPLQMVCGSGFSVAIAGVLYMLTYRYFDKQNPIDFEAMSWAPTTVDAMQLPTEGWSWKALPPPPFHSGVNSYALHPDECTIFMTAKNNYTTGNPRGTYSFNTKESAWTWHGEWALPFLGQAHFDVELDAWVGLHPDGYISSCQVVSPTYYNKRAPTMFLDCQTTKEKLFRKDQGRHMKASLTYMGGTKFCLIECVSSKNFDDEQLAWGDGGFMLYVTIFGLKYNRKGELQTTHHQSARSFSVSRHGDYFSPFAFWM